MYSSQAIFFGSEAEKPGHKNLRAADPMPKKERNANLGYVKLDSKPTALQCDAVKYQEICREYGIPFETIFFSKSNRSRSNMHQIMHNLFQKDLDVTMLVFCGSSAYPDGSFVSSSSKKDNLSFKSVLDLWSQRNPRQRHLFIILDTSYSGQWIKDLIESGEVSITLQASCLAHQLAYEDKKIGGYFTHNLYRTLKKQVNLPIIEPALQPQTPVYFGSFHYVYYYLGLKIKFESWADMRTAMGASPYGAWPRISISDSVIDEKKKVNDSKPSNKALNNYSSTKLLNQKETLFVTNKHTDINQNDSKKRAKSPIKDTDKILVSAFLTPKAQPIVSDFPPIEFLVDKGGKRYEGNVDLNGNKEAFGVLYDHKNIMEYQGQFHKDMKWGKGILYDLNGVKYYQGEFANDVKCGHGKIFDKHGMIIFEGQFAEDEKNGFGIEYFSTGEKRFEGMFADSKRLGLGSEFYKNGQKKNEGYWLNGIRHGKATDFLDNGIVIFRGNYSEGVINGKGKLYDTNGILKYEGEFVSNKYHGLGAVYAENGELLQEGLFENGEYKEYRKFERINEVEEDEEVIKSKVLMATQRVRQEDTQLVLDLAKKDNEVPETTTGRVLLPLEKRIEKETKEMIQTKNLNPYKQKALAPKKAFKNSDLGNEGNDSIHKKPDITKNYEIMNNVFRSQETPTTKEVNNIDTTLEMPKVFVTKKAVIEVSSTFDNYTNISQQSQVINVSSKVEKGLSEDQNDVTTSDPNPSNQLNVSTINQNGSVDRKLTNEEMMAQNVNESHSPAVMNINDPNTKTNFKVKDYLANVIKSKATSTNQESSLQNVNVNFVMEKPKSYTVSAENRPQAIKLESLPSKHSLDEKLKSKKASRSPSPKNLITKPDLKSNISFKALDNNPPSFTEIPATPEEPLVPAEEKKSEGQAKVKDLLKSKKSKAEDNTIPSSKKNSTVSQSRPSGGSRPSMTDTRRSNQDETVAIKS